MIPRRQEETGKTDFLQPSGCLGWTVADILCHVLGDARRALAALATPASPEPDVDFVSCWAPWRPGGVDDLVRARGLRAARAVVTVAGGPAGLVDAWQETAPAAVRLAGWRLTRWWPPRVTRSPWLTLPARWLDGLLGVSPAAGWDDTAYALRGTGRKGLTPQDRAILADLADRFPLFG